LIVGELAQSLKAMRITRLKAAVVEGNFDWTFVRVETNEGVSGTGECFFAPGLTSILRQTRVSHSGRRSARRRLFRKLQLAASGAGSVAGIIYNAIAGTEIALWDVLGQWADMPVYRLLGGKFRESIRIYGDCHAGRALESLGAVLRTRQPSWLNQKSKQDAADFVEETAVDLTYTPQMYAQLAREMEASGFTALKFDIDVPNPFTLDRYSRCLTNRQIEPTGRRTPFAVSEG
jgi:L-alanine-DL-glutamate epimerase-like enolase superfamily enzyme